MRQDSALSCSIKACLLVWVLFLKACCKRWPWQSGHALPLALTPLVLCLAPTTQLLHSCQAVLPPCYNIHDCGLCREGMHGGGDQARGGYSCAKLPLTVVAPSPQIALVCQCYAVTQPSCDLQRYEETVEGPASAESSISCVALLLFIFGRRSSKQTCVLLKAGWTAGMASTVWHSQPSAWKSCSTMTAFLIETEIQRTFVTCSKCHSYAKVQFMVQVLRNVQESESCLGMNQGLSATQQAAVTCTCITC